HLEVDRACRDDGREGIGELVDRGVVVTALRQCLGPGQDRLGPGALVARDAALQERAVDAESKSEPLDRLARRPRLPALDLRDVFLREALACEIALRKSRRDPQLAQAIPETRPAGNGGSRACDPSGHGSRSVQQPVKKRNPSMEVFARNPMVM